MKHFLGALALMLLTGCVGLQVDYGSDPPGATLYQDGQVIGVTPARITYEPDQTFSSGGCMNLRGTAVKWASGAAAQISFLSVCKSLGTLQHYVFNRPDVPGRDIDANYALQLQRNGIMRSQADAANTAATLQIMRALQPPAPAFNPPVNCRSYRVGNEIRTDCN